MHIAVLGIYVRRRLPYLSHCDMTPDVHADKRGQARGAEEGGERIAHVVDGAGAGNLLRELTVWICGALVGMRCLVFMRPQIYSCRVIT